MLPEQFTVILLKYHISGSDNHIRLMSKLDLIHVVSEGTDIGIVDLVDLRVLVKEKLQLSSLGIDIVCAARAKMLCERSRILAHIYLYMLDVTVGHVGYGKIYYPVSSEEGKGRDGSELVHPVHLHIVC